jgi:lipoprotein-anchoring transpeptidase ErfK/SrfK
MDRPKVYLAIVGNDFIVPKTKPIKPKIELENEPQALPASMPAFAGFAESSVSPRYFPSVQLLSGKLLRKLIYSGLLLTVVALLSLNSVPANLYVYVSDKIAVTKNSLPSPKPVLPASAVLINDSDKDAKLSSLTQQSVVLTLNNKQIKPSSDDIAKWVKVSNSTNGKVLMAVKPNIVNYLNTLATQNSKKPVDQVIATRQDGFSQVVIDGQNGVNFGDLQSTASQIAKKLMGAQGLNINLPSSTTQFNTVAAPAGFKWIDVNIAAKHMEMYEQGTVVQTYPVSAGAPETPTPQGHFKIFEKLPVQDMRGYNANGTKYFQPHVRWVSYFSGSNAIHGNYWRPLSWFGDRNSSHGCVSIPDDQAKLIYDWAPIGTPVVVHT